MNLSKVKKAASKLKQRVGNNLLPTSPTLLQRIAAGTSELTFSVLFAS